MNSFVDTSILIAASTATDIRRSACQDLLTKAKPNSLFCAAHSLAEIFAVLSGRPRPTKASPLDAASVVTHVRRTIVPIELTSDEYLRTIESVARLGHSGGIIYDALLMACARKAKAKRIYTLNIRHFRMLAPDLAHRILEP